MSGLTSTEKRLSAKGLLNVPTDTSAGAFSFVFASGRYESPRFFADFLSPRLCEYHIGGLPQDEFTFETHLTIGDFEKFISCCCSSFSGLSEEERSLFVTISRELGNWEISSMVSIECEGLSKSIVEQVRGCCQNHHFESISDDEMGILAKHFHELPETLLNECPIDFLSALLSHSDLQIKDEDSLVTFLISLWTSDPAYFVLSEFILFEFVSASQIGDFVESIFHFVTEINRGLWRSMCDRLILPVRFHMIWNRITEQGGVVSIPFRACSPLDGIIRYLSWRCQGNVHERGLVRITATSVYTDRCPAHQLADLDSDNYFASKDDRDQWFCYDFTDHRVVLTDYSVRPYTVADHNPQSWVVESSVDGESWTELDRKFNYDDLRDPRVVRSFPISDRVECRMVRFRQTGPSRANRHFLCLTAFEVFGTLQENDIH
jgi:hypothetical protein